MGKIRKVPDARLEASGEIIISEVGDLAMDLAIEIHTYLRNPQRGDIALTLHNIGVIETQLNHAFKRLEAWTQTNGQ